MAEIICSQCGNPNPDDLEQCQFCGASLIPPANAAGEANQEPVQPGSGSAHKTLARFEKVHLPIKGGKSSAIPVNPDDDDEVPSENPPDNPDGNPAVNENENVDGNPPTAPAPDDNQAAPDWLSGLESAGVQEEQIPDWLKGLGGDQIEAAQEPPEPVESEEPEEPGQPVEPVIPPRQDEAPLVLESSPEAPEVDETGLPEEPAARLPDEPSGEQLSPVQESPAQISPVEAEEQFAQAEQNKSDAPEAAFEEEEPDWLKTLQGRQPEMLQDQPTSPEELPDWLSNLPVSQEEETPGSQPGQNEGEDAGSHPDEPDWLSDFDSRAIAPEPTVSEELPDWLKLDQTIAETPAPPAEESLPDWLSGGSGISEPSEPPESAKPTEEPEAAPASPFVEEPVHAAASIPSEAPDWLTLLQADVDAAQQASEEPQEFEPASPENPAELAQFQIDGNIPDWLTRIDPDQAAPGSSTPALIADNRESVPQETPTEPFSVDMPDWLSLLNPEAETESESPSKADEPDPGKDPKAAPGPLEAAELPAWVQAMRPVESVVEAKTAGLDDSVVETSGPLAGLHGVLPVMPSGPKRKPRSYSSSIHVSEGQQRYASYLEKLVAGEMHARPAQKSRITSNQVLRWVLTLVLFLAAGLPLVINGGVVYPTLLEPSDAFASASVVDGLSATQPVLVAFDYDPALSGEMEAVAAPLMDRLLARHIPLVLVSTSPTGPVLAQHFLDNAPLINQYDLSGAGQTVNLGYLPGGSAGLLYFGEDPTGSMPFTVQGASAWATTPFSGVQGMANFGAVLVITDNSDTGRDWVEQVAPRLGGTPMLMMISAQAEPMLRPYFDSGQIKGFISGLSDAKIYEQRFNRPGQAYHFWPAFKVGMLIAEILIVAGAAYGLYSDWRIRSKESRGEA